MIFGVEEFVINRVSYAELKPPGSHMEDINPLLKRSTEVSLLCDGGRVCFSRAAKNVGTRTTPSTNIIASLLFCFYKKFV